MCGQVKYRSLLIRLKRHGIAECEYLYLSETKHETYSSDDETMDKYINKILAFLQK